MNFIPRVFEFLSVISFWQSNSIVINKLALLSKRRHIWYFAYRQYYIDLFIYRFVFLYCFLVFNLSIILQRIQFSPSNIYIYTYMHICVEVIYIYICIYASKFPQTTHAWNLNFLLSNWFWTLGDAPASRSKFAFYFSVDLSLAEHSKSLITSVCKVYMFDLLIKIKNTKQSTLTSKLWV